MADPAGRVSIAFDATPMTVDPTWMRIDNLAGCRVRDWTVDRGRPSEFEKTFQNGKLYSLPELTKKFKNVARLPVSLRIVLESLLRNTDGKRVRESDVETLARWQPKAERT